jgi:hypothetical protein
LGLPPATGKEEADMAKTVSTTTRVVQDVDPTTLLVNINIRLYHPSTRTSSRAFASTACCSLSSVPDSLS